MLTRGKAEEDLAMPAVPLRRPRRRLAVVTHDFPTTKRPHRGAPIWETLKAMSRYADLTVYCPVPQCPGVSSTWIGGGTYGEMPAPLTAPGLVVCAVPYLSIPVVSHGRNGESIRRRLHRRLQVLKPDVILSYWIYPDAYAAVRAGQQLGIPVVAGSRGSDLKVRDGNASVRESIRYTLEHASAVLTVSQDLAAAAARISGTGAEVYPISNGVDTSVFRVRDSGESRAQLKLRRDVPLILFVGRLVRAKGVVQLLEAVRILNERQFPICAALIGGGELEGELRNKAKVDGTAGQVLFPGEMPAAQVAVWMSAADAICLPSDSEGCPNVIKEALSCGRPVVATKVGGIPEMVDSASGILIQENTAPVLADALRECLGGAWNREEIARCQSRSWDHVAQETLAVCERVLASNDARGAA